MTVERTQEQRERMASRSLGEAGRYREQAANLTDWQTLEGFPDAAAETCERVKSDVRAGLGHEVWSEHLLGRLSWDEYLVGDKLLPTWHGSDLETFLAAIRAVAGE